MKTAKFPDGVLAVYKCFVISCIFFQAAFQNPPMLFIVKSLLKSTLLKSLLKSKNQTVNSTPSTKKFNSKQCAVISKQLTEKHK